LVELNFNNFKRLRKRWKGKEREVNVSEERVMEEKQQGTEGKRGRLMLVRKE
jgi:hypothetical protein